MFRSLFQKSHPKLAVMGAFRTGTNYIRFLLEKNFACRILYDAYGWKHAGVPIWTRYSQLAYPSLPVVYVYKHPASFVASLFGYHTTVKRNISAPFEWEAFLRSPLVIFDSKLGSSSQLRFSNPVQYWNFIYWNLSHLPEDRFRSVGLSYESVLDDPEGQMSEVARQLSLKRISATFEVPEQKMARLNDRHGLDPNKAVTDQVFDPARYDKQNYLRRYSEADLDFLLSEADPHLMQRFGYQVEALVF